MKKQPKLTIIGAGPGDPELITIRGLKALQTAEVVLYDALVNPKLLEHAPNATHVFVGKRRNFKKYKQHEINQLVVNFAKTCTHIVRLKGGDPFVFGRGFEEMEYAKAHGLATEYIPGISSSISVPGLAEIPVTHRNLSRSFWVMTGTTSDGSLSPEIYEAAVSNATVVVLMGLSKLSQITEIFHAHGKGELPVAVLQEGSLPTAKSVFGTVNTILENIAKEGVRSPAVIVLGEVVGLQHVAASFSRRPEPEVLV